MKRVVLPLIFIMAAGFCSAAEEPAQVSAKAVTVSDNDFWNEDWGPDSFPRISDDRISQVLLQIRNQNPARADELEKLREENIDEFRSQLRQEIMRLYRQQPGGPGPGPGPGREDRPGRGRPDGQRPEGDRPSQQDSRPEPGSPERWRERWERRHDDFIAWLEKNYPVEAVALKQFREQVREKEPDKYIDRVMEKMRTYDPIRDQERRNPRLAQLMKEDLDLQRQRDALIRQIHSANEKDKEKLTAELKENVSRRFNVIMERKRLQYEDLKKRLEELQKEVCKQEQDLEKLKNNKDKLVEEHVKDLEGKAEKMQWN